MIHSMHVIDVEWDLVGNGLIGIGLVVKKMSNALLSAWKVFLQLYEIKC